MSKIPSIQEYEGIVDIVKRFPEGARIDQVEAELPFSLTRRTLQRRLGELSQQGVIGKEGQGRATRYLFRGGATQEAHVNEPATRTATGASAIPLSQEARQIAHHIGKPLQQRIPVGYNREFLDSYRPNESFYLPESVRVELLSQGRAVNADEPAGTFARRIANRLLIDLSWNSSRLEGNTYSLLETERLLSMGEEATGRSLLEAQMILNHKETIEFLLSSADEVGFNRYTILNMHALLSDNLLEDPMACGRLRSIPVGIAQTVFYPLEGPQRIEECFQQVLDTAAAIKNPFEQAFFVMVHLPYLQPFEDVNKRVSRLASNIPLIKHNLCPLSFIDVSKEIYISAMLGIYELNRIELLRDVFLWAYKRSCARYSAVRQSIGEPDPFRVVYRTLISETVAHVVRLQMSKVDAIAFIRRRAEEAVPSKDRNRFIEVVETQLMSLHEGNIARYRLRSGEFDVWRKSWK
jgi:Fic family protein